MAQAQALTHTDSVAAAAHALIRAGAGEAAEAAEEGEAPLRRPGALLALTDGPNPALLISRSSAWRLHVPQVECVNAIGVRAAAHPSPRAAAPW